MVSLVFQHYYYYHFVIYHNCY